MQSGPLVIGAADHADQVLPLTNTAGTIGPDGSKLRLGLRIAGSRNDMAPLVSSFQLLASIATRKVAR